MNTSEKKYQVFGLIKDMLNTPDIIRQFDASRYEAVGDAIGQSGKLLITGEGSSRLIPAKHAMKILRQRGGQLQVATEAGCQAAQYDLSDWSVVGLSNSGRTAEVISLFKTLSEKGHHGRYSVTAFADSALESYSDDGFVLTCGEEGAVAATKSVVEQVLGVQAIIDAAERTQTDYAMLADAFEEALTCDIPEDIVSMLVDAPVINWAGWNDGIAEELTLKTNEITRKRADFFEGTYAAHGVEEVLTAKDVIIWIDPIEWQEDKFHEVLVAGAGVNVVAISSRQTRFPTIQVKDCGELTGMACLAAGWNLLVEAGLALDVNIDKPVRARKVGNEFLE